MERVLDYGKTLKCKTNYHGTKWRLVSAEPLIRVKEEREYGVRVVESSEQ